MQKETLHFFLKLSEALKVAVVSVQLPQFESGYDLPKTWLENYYCYMHRHSLHPKAAENARLAEIYKSKHPSVIKTDS